MGELLSSLSSRELAEWMAYERIEPFGEIRGDLRAATVCRTMAKDSRLSDFLIDYEKPWREREGQGVEEAARNITSSLPSSKSKSGTLVVYEGDAPPIKRIGKRGKMTPAKRRLQEILRGKSR